MKRAWVFLFLLCSCQGVLYRPADSLVTTLQAEPSTLNPLLSNESASASVTGNIYEALLELDRKTLNYKPKLAESWEIAADHLTYTFHLRKNVFWQDGAPFSAADVLFTFATIMDPNVRAEAHRSALTDVTEVIALDEFTVQVRYHEPYFRALEVIGFTPILPKHIFEKGDFSAHPANQQPLGTGPYRLAKRSPHQSFVLERFDAYWGEKPFFRKKILQIIPDRAVVFFQLRKKALDVEELTAVQWRRKAQTPEFQKDWYTFSYYLPNFSAVAWNMRDAKLSDPRVRKALALAFNREQFLAGAMMGEGRPVIGSFYAESRYYAHHISPLSYNLVEAQKLFAEAGWNKNAEGWLEKNGQSFSLKFFYPQGSTFFRSFSLVYQVELQKIGVKLEIRELEWSTLFDFVTKREFDAVGIGWRLPLEQDPYQLWHSSQADQGSNLSGLHNAEVDQLLVEARREFDPEKRAVYYKHLQEILYQEQPYLFLYNTPTFAAVSKRFDRVQLYPLGLELDEWTTARLEPLPVW